MNNQSNLDKAIVLGTKVKHAVTLLEWFGAKSREYGVAVRDYAKRLREKRR